MDKLHSLRSQAGARLSPGIETDDCRIIRTHYRVRNVRNHQSVVDTAFHTNTFLFKQQQQSTDAHLYQHATLRVLQ